VSTNGYICSTSLATFTYIFRSSCNRERTGFRERELGLFEKKNTEKEAKLKLEKEKERI
jgi:hypothetical protein